MKTKSLLIALTAAALFAATVPAAHAFANIGSSYLTAGEMHWYRVPLSSSPSTRTRVQVTLSAVAPSDPGVDFNASIFDSRGRCVTSSEYAGSDSLSAFVEGEYCTVYVRCVSGRGTYRAVMAVQNFPSMQVVPVYRFRR